MCLMSYFQCMPHRWECGSNRMNTSYLACLRPFLPAFVNALSLQWRWSHSLMPKTMNILVDPINLALDVDLLDFVMYFQAGSSSRSSSGSNSGLHIVYCIVYESKEEQVWCAFWMKNPSLKVHKWENLTENWINRWWIWMFGMNNGKPHLKHWIIETIVHHICTIFKNDATHSPIWCDFQFEICSLQWSNIEIIAAHRNSFIRTKFDFIDLVIGIFEYQMSQWFWHATNYHKITHSFHIQQFRFNVFSLLSVSS